MLPLQPYMPGGNIVKLSEKNKKTKQEKKVGGVGAVRGDNWYGVVIKPRDISR
jgi:hypothetical protein